MAGPLSHIRVLDLSRIMAGPWASQVLADLGADVIKVERPGAGDDTRSWGPPFLKNADGSDIQGGGLLPVGEPRQALHHAEPGQARRPAHRHALAARSDILLENYKVGTLQALRPRIADSLRKENPRLIYCSVTGFGQTGPRRDQAAYDFLIQAMGGLMSITGERDDKPGGGPQKVGIPIVDIMTGMYAAVAMLAALARREVSGTGRIHRHRHARRAGRLPRQPGDEPPAVGQGAARAGNAHPNIQPQDVFPCRDGKVVIVVGNDAQFAKFCEVLGRPEWIDGRALRRPIRRACATSAC